MITSTKTTAFSFHCHRQIIPMKRFIFTQTTNHHLSSSSSPRYRRPTTSSCRHLHYYGMNNGLGMNNDNWKKNILSSSMLQSHESHQMIHDESSNYSLELEIETPQDMEEVGGILSMGTCGGDIILLGGDLGAGKTCFSRGFVRARTGLMDISVTSPTYLLSNTYPTDDSSQTLYVLLLYI